MDVNTRVRALEYLIQQKGLTGVVETVPTFSSLLVYYDPRAVGYEPLCAAIAELVPQATTAVLPPARTVELPCCYDAELGFDLETAAPVSRCRSTSWSACTPVPSTSCTSSASLRGCRT